MNCSAPATAVKNVDSPCVFSRRLELHDHAGRGVDEQRDAPARIRHFLAREPGMRIGQRDREERQPGQEQHQRQVPHAAPAAIGASPAGAPAAPMCVPRRVPLRMRLTSSTSSGDRQPARRTPAAPCGRRRTADPPSACAATRRAWCGARSGGLAVVPRSNPPSVNRCASRAPRRAHRPASASTRRAARTASSLDRRRHRAPWQSGLAVASVARGAEDAAARPRSAPAARACARRDAATVAQTPWRSLVGVDRRRHAARALRRSQPVAHGELPFALGRVRADEVLRHRPPERDRAGDAQRRHARRASSGVQPSARIRCHVAAAPQTAAEHRRRRQLADDRRRLARGSCPQARTSAKTASTPANANATHAQRRVASDARKRRDSMSANVWPDASRMSAALAARATGPASAAPAARRSGRGPRAAAAARLEVVGHGQRRDVHVLAEEAFAQQPHRVLELDVAPRRRDHVLVARRR